MKTIWDWVFIIGVVVALACKTWVVSATVVPSSSLYPTIPATPTHHVYILNNKLATEFGQKIYQGEVVIFHFPDKSINLPGKHYPSITFR